MWPFKHSSPSSPEINQYNAYTKHIKDIQHVRDISNSIVKEIDENGWRLWQDNSFEDQPFWLTSPESPEGKRDFSAEGYIRHSYLEKDRSEHLSSLEVEIIARTVEDIWARREAVIGTIALASVAFNS